MLVFLCLQAFCCGSESVCVCVCATFIIKKADFVSAKYSCFSEMRAQIRALWRCSMLSLRSDDDDETNVFFRISADSRH